MVKGLKGSSLDSLDASDPHPIDNTKEDKSIGKMQGHSVKKGFGSAFSFCIKILKTCFRAFLFVVTWGNYGFKKVKPITPSDPFNDETTTTVVNTAYKALQGAPAEKSIEDSDKIPPLESTEDKNLIPKESVSEDGVEKIHFFHKEIYKELNELASLLNDYSENKKPSLAAAINLLISKIEKSVHGKLSKSDAIYNEKVQSDIETSLGNLKKIWTLLKTQPRRAPQKKVNTKQLLQKVSGFEVILDSIEFQNKDAFHQIKKAEEVFQTLMQLFPEYLDDATGDRFQSILAKIDATKALIEGYQCQLGSDASGFLLEEKQEREKLDLQALTEKIETLRFNSPFDFENAVKIKNEITSKIEYLQNLLDFSNVAKPNDLEKEPVDLKGKGKEKQASDEVLSSNNESLSQAIQETKANYELCLKQLSEQIISYGEAFIPLLIEEHQRLEMMEDDILRIIEAKHDLRLFHNFHQQFSKELENLEALDFKGFKVYAEANDLLKEESIENFHGIGNIGNSCYLNSALQVLLQIPALKSLILKETWNTDLAHVVDVDFYLQQIRREGLEESRLTRAEFKAILEGWKDIPFDVFDEVVLIGTFEKYDPALSDVEIGLLNDLFTKVRIEKRIENAIKNVVRTYDSPGGTMSAAVRELRSALFETGMFGDERLTAMQDAVQIWEKLFKNLGFNFGLIENAYFPESENTLGDSKREPYSLVQLSLPEKPEDEEEKAAIPTLQEVFDQFFSKKRVNTPRSVIGLEEPLAAWDEKYSIDAPPQYLAVQLKRYGWNAEEEEAFKINTRYKVPENCVLDLSNAFEGSGITYRIKAVVHHDDFKTGRANTGHYTALVEKNGIWKYANDSSVTVVSNPTHMIEAGYLYLLERVS